MNINATGFLDNSLNLSGLFSTPTPNGNENGDDNNNRNPLKNIKNICLIVIVGLLVVILISILASDHTKAGYACGGR